MTSILQLACPQLLVEHICIQLARQFPKIVEDGVGAGLSRLSLAEVKEHGRNNRSQDVDWAHLCTPPGNLPDHFTKK